MEITNKLLNGLMYVSLPKWPQMYTTGKPVTRKQAMEIIRRTDTFFSLLMGGNNSDYDRRVADMLRVPLFKPENQSWETWDSVRQAFRERWAPVESSYVYNEWISSSFVEGPHGWCHPNGEIGFVDNVGKWPDISQIHSDWSALVREFPFLEVDVTLMSDESCVDTRKPLVGMRVRNGVVSLVDPGDTSLHKDHPPARRGNALECYSEKDAVAMRFSEFTTPDGRSSENAIPWSWIEEWAKKYG